MLGMEAGAKMVAWGQSRWEGPGHQEEAPAKASGCHVPDQELPVSVWAPVGPWLSQEPPLVPAPESDPGSLSEDCPRLACPRQAGALEDCAGVQFGVPGAVGRSQPGVTSHGGPWADSGGRPQPGNVVPPRVCARHHGTGAGRGLSQASACPRGVLSAPCSVRMHRPLLVPRLCNCGDKVAAAVDVRLETPGRNMSGLLGRELAQEWTPEMRATPETVLRGPSAGDGNVRAQIEHPALR